MKKTILIMLLACFTLALPCEAKKKPKGEVTVELSPSNTLPTIFNDSIISFENISVVK